MRQKKISHQDESGFTLIEVLIATAIFTIGILSVNAMQIAAIRGNYVANGLTEASVLVADEIEKIMSSPYADVPLGITTTTIDDYTLERNVTDNTSMAPFTRMVEVTVAGRQREVSLFFVKSDYEP
jgi:prepilin-type N-terminal cleavage/methylation domain-containing protein